MTADTVEAKPRHRWFQFSLRSLFVVMTLFALLLGYTTHRARQQREAVEAITALGGTVIYDHQFQFDKSISFISSPGSMYFEATGREWLFSNNTEPAGPQWARKWIGDEYFQDVAAVDLSWIGWEWEKPTENINVRLLGKLQGLRWLNLDGRGFTDKDLRHIKQLATLERLFLKDTHVTDEGLTYLKDLTNLQYLSLADTQITDDGLVHLKGLKNLEVLELCRTKISDAGLENFKALKNLKWIYVSDTQVTKEGAEKLEKTLPNCHVFLVGAAFAH